MVGKRGEYTLGEIIGFAVAAGVLIIVAIALIFDFNFLGDAGRFIGDLLG